MKVRMSEPERASIEFLNAVLQHKLTGINQYFLHARMLKHQGLVEIADYTYRSSIDAMKSSDMLVEMILSVGGIPNMKNMEEIVIGSTPSAMLQSDLEHAEKTLHTLNDALELCGKKNMVQATALLERIHSSQKERIEGIQTLLQQLNISAS